MTGEASVAGRLERAAPYLVGLALALPVLLVKYPPMADLPLHAVVAAYLRHWGDASFVPEGLFRLNLGHPNQLMYFAMAGLHFILPLDWAVKLTVALAVFALPVSAARLCDYLGSPRLVTMLVAPLALGWLFYWGLLANLIALSVLLALLPVLDAYAERPSVRGFLQVLGLLLLLHFSHQAILLTVLGLVVVLTLTRPLSLALTSARLLPALVIALGTALARRFIWAVATPRHAEASDAFYPITHKLTTIPGVLFAGFEPWVRNTLFGLALLVLLMFAWEGIRARRWPVHAPKTWGDLRDWAHCLRFELCAVLLFLGYLVLPASIKSSTLVYHRFLHPAWIILVLSLAARGRDGQTLSGWRLPRVLSPTVPLATLLIAWPVFADAHRVYSELEVLLPRIEKGSAIMALGLGKPVPNRLWTPPVAESHVVAMRGGRTPFSFAESPVAPVTFLPNKPWYLVYNRVARDSYAFRPAHDLRQIRYLLLYVTEPNVTPVVLAALARDAAFIARSGEWVLLESRHEVVSPAADDVPLPTPRPPSLRRLIREQIGDPSDTVGP